MVMRIYSRADMLICGQADRRRSGWEVISGMACGYVVCGGRGLDLVVGGCFHILSD